MTGFFCVGFDCIILQQILVDISRFSQISVDISRYQQILLDVIDIRRYYTPTLLRPLCTNLQIFLQRWLYRYLFEYHQISVDISVHISVHISRYQQISVDISIISVQIPKDNRSDQKITVYLSVNIFLNISRYQQISVDISRFPRWSTCTTQSPLSTQICRDTHQQHSTDAGHKQQLGTIDYTLYILLLNILHYTLYIIHCQHSHQQHSTDAALNSINKLVLLLSILYSVAYIVHCISHQAILQLFFLISISHLIESYK